MVNSKGTTLCSSPKGLFSFKFDVKSPIDKDNWSAEFRILFSQLIMKEPSNRAYESNQIKELSKKIIENTKNPYANIKDLYMDK